MLRPAVMRNTRPSFGPCAAARSPPDARCLGGVERGTLGLTNDPVRGMRAYTVHCTGGINLPRPGRESFLPDPGVRRRTAARRGGFCCKV
jgi:hypothetical protein